MNTKKYLGQVTAFERKIRLLQMEIEKMRMLAESISVNIDSERVQTSGDKDSMANAVVAILQKEDALATTIVLYTDSKNIISRQIEGMDNKMYSDVLYGRYVVGMDFYQIGLVIGKKKRWTFKIYSDALEDFERQYGHLYMDK